MEAVIFSNIGLNVVEVDEARKGLSETFSLYPNNPQQSSS